MVEKFYEVQYKPFQANVSLSPATQEYSANKLSQNEKLLWVQIWSSVSYNQTFQ